ncbi:MAG: GNAT family N-acetyltransferase [Candidatus Omnitrophica bacterium]|nr:GNAT family N-acetyltransferase [Candidatus Omnitrophota bacterium]
MFNKAYNFIIIIVAMFALLLPASGFCVVQPETLRVPISLDNEPFNDKFNSAAHSISGKNKPETQKQIPTVQNISIQEVPLSGDNIFLMREEFNKFSNRISSYLKENVKRVLSEENSKKINKDSSQQLVKEYADKFIMAKTLAQDMRNAIREDNGTLLVAHDNGVLVGSMLFRLKRNELEIGYAVVHPEYEGKWILSKMNRIAINQARENGIKTAITHVNNNNKRLLQAMEEDGAQRKAFRRIGLEVIEAKTIIADFLPLHEYKFRILPDDTSKTLPVIKEISIKDTLKTVSDQTNI